ncbi:MAG: hypothetical protein HY791_19310, partial [Deltaproteobacteria bacterium]|nr:hypothetical protein [Deltaproteobacteria bacterium]
MGAVQLTYDDLDGQIGPSDVPDLVFATTISAGTLAGDIRALSGDDGHLLWVAGAPDQIPLAELAADDIDGDGIVEIIAPKRRDASGYHLIAFEHTGEQKWVSTPSTITVPGIDISPGAISIANLDG